jgi:hypothetical protein
MIPHLLGRTARFSLHWSQHSKGNITMQLKAENWQTFGWTLAIALVCGIAYAIVIHWASKKKLIGQTAWSVVIGVAFTLLIMIPFFGLNAVAFMFAYFSATGAPMVIEYLARVQDELKRDQESARELARGMVNDHETANR